jgi:AraC-like DNA-binding protein
MQRLVFSTDDIPETERFSYWRAAAGDGLLGSRVEPDKDPERPFTSRAINLRAGSVGRARLRADRHSSFRGPREIARRSWHDHFLFYREFSAGAWFGWDRGELVTRPGELAIGDPIVPLAARPRTDFDYEVWVLPRKLLDPHLPASRRPRSFMLIDCAGLDGMIKAYLDAFAGQFESLGDGGVDLVADNFCRLLAVAFGSAAGEQREPIRLARLEEAKRHIDLHLADPNLTPEKAAGALRVSVRSLHLLFEPSGESFAQYVLRRRLEECRAALTSPIGERSITDVAFGWGFNNLTTFYRAFRRAFGATPGELRAQAERL